MKVKTFFLLAFSIVPGLLSWKTPRGNWITEKHKSFTIFYTPADKLNKKEYVKFIEDGIKSVNRFFNHSFKNNFSVYIHPHRRSLDSAWKKDWNMPAFTSECWMVASGVGHKLDMISPKFWDKESCEHKYANTNKTRQLITHELVHVYHGQQNRSPDFSDVTGLDWFVEGLATYASGQYDSVRNVEIKRAMAENKVPESLDKFWTGPLKYGLSGSMVMYIDKTYGRTLLTGLLRFNTLPEILASLNISELELITGWKKYMLNNSPGR